MFALALRYLNGWAMAAADGAKKQQAEWPPHPDRVFMALAAAWFETGENPTEGEALRWLEALPNPAIAAPLYAVRSLTTSYVPVNDARMGRKIPADHALGKLKDAGLAVLPEFRSRQPRAFPVAIPLAEDPIVHLIWQDAELGEHRAALDALAAKLTHVGHSASFVQAWLDNAPPEPNLIPESGLGLRKLRAPSPERLTYLRERMNRDAVIAHGDLQGEIESLKERLAWRKKNTPPRTSWDDMPDALLLAGESTVKQHPFYAQAKQGDADAARRLVDDCLTLAAREAVRNHLAPLITAEPLILACAHAWEGQGVNAIPAILAKRLSETLNLEYEQELIQTNYVGHTGADGFTRLARQAAFGGPVAKGAHYVIVDDFIGQGGTLANLRGYLMKNGGKVFGAVALTGKPYSAKLNPSKEQLDELQRIHGKALDRWWKDHFGHPFRQLTQSEARYLARTPDADRVRTKIAAAKQAGNHAGHRLGKREIEQRITTLEQRLAEQFPQGRPISLRPEPGRWASYRPVKPPQPDAPRNSLFDPNFLVFTLTGRRLSLPATLKLTAALRGLLLKKSGVQPPPEWLSGHRPDGRPGKDPHMALFPLPFVDAEHADGRVMGLGLALPRILDPREVGECLEPILLDPDTGLAERHDLFECGLELELRERPPKNLRPETWTRASEIWASVTPVVLDRHYDGADKWERAADDIRTACARIGLPEPMEAQLHPVSGARGAPHAREFPHLTRKSDGGRRYHIHARLIFEQPVTGPILLGAGRFRGYGLFRPMDQPNKPGAGGQIP